MQTIKKGILTISDDNRVHRHLKERNGEIVDFLYMGADVGNGNYHLIVGEKHEYYFQEGTDFKRLK